MKKTVLILLILSCVVFGIRRSENWKGVNYTITTNAQTMAVPYTQTGYSVHALSGATLNVVMSKNGVVATDNLTSREQADYYPASWRKNDTIKLSSTGTTEVFVLIYEETE